MKRKVRVRRGRVPLSHAALSDWRMAFGSGFDWLHFLLPFGLKTDEEVRAAMPAAWERLGAAYLQDQSAKGQLGPDAEHPYRDLPFALERFGPPPGWTPPRKSRKRTTASVVLGRNVAAGVEQ